MYGGTPHEWSEINMVPISYRASPVFYVQTARFIVYDADPDIVTIMAPTRQADLTNRVAALHGFGGSDPSPQRIREQLEAPDNAGIDRKRDVSGKSVSVRVDSGGCRTHKKKKKT